MKVFATFALFLAVGLVPARADTYTITFNVISETTSAPTPAFQFISINGGGFNFNFSGDTGIPLDQPWSIPDFNLTELFPIYLCDGCNVVTNSPGAVIGASTMVMNGQALLYFPGDPNGLQGEILDNAIAAIPNYYALGTLSIVDSTDPVGTPEPPSFWLLIIGLCLLPLVRKARTLRT